MIDDHRFEPCDAIIVLGAKIDDSGRAGPALARRARYGAGLWRQGRAPYMIASGGGRAAISEAQKIRDIALAAGVDDAAIVIESESMNTWENAQRCAEILRERDWQRVLLVTDHYHMRRSVAIFRHFKVQAIACPAPIGGLGFGQRLGHQGREQLAMLLMWWRILTDR